MMRWKKWLAGSLVGLVAAVLAVAAADDKPDKAPADGGLVIVDARGKEQKLKTWDFVIGTRRLNWLAPTGKKDPDKKDDKGIKDDKTPRRPVTPRPQGPQALAFRDENSTTWVDGVLTLIPLDRLRSIEFDNENATATVRVATSDKADGDAVLTGTTRFPRVNKIIVEAEVDKGELGVAAVKFQGGVKNGIKAIRFPAPRASAPAAGRPAVVVVNVDSKKKATERVTDLQVLYRTASGEKLSSTLLFKKTIKVDVAKLKKLVAVGEGGAEWQVVLKDGNDETFTLLQTGELDGTRVSLEGLIGKVPAGYKLFPIHVVAEVQLDVTKTDDKP